MLDNSQTNLPIPLLTWDDVNVDVLLGQGSFSSVYRVKLRDVDVDAFPSQIDECDSETVFKLPEEDEDRIKPDFDHDKGTDRSSSCTSVSIRSLLSLSMSTGFALKRLSATGSSAADMKSASVGISIEADLLTNVLPEHPNIVRIFGISEGFHLSPVDGFILMECLVETFEQRLCRWKNKKSSASSRWPMFQRRLESHSDLTWQEHQHLRVSQVGPGVAKALSFLHKHQVLYRDLKPANIGFDGEGQVRLIDFDLSCHLTETDKKLTMCVGSLRYMSPECALGLHYGFASDVHSFGVLLWEICTLKKPFSGAKTAIQMRKKVFIGQERPPLRNVASAEVRALLRSCWDPTASLRPTMHDVVNHFCPNEDTIA